MIITRLLTTDYGETRYVTFGFFEGRIVSVVHTFTDDVIRIISVRKATENEPKDSLRKSQTDWARVDAMSDDDIDFTDCPEITDEMWEKAVLSKGFKPLPQKSQENLPIDRDIIEFFKSQELNYPAKINQLLRDYMEAHRTK
jgi:uncharacterized protein (DUF4415 family)